MKKIMAVMFAFVVAFQLCACGANGNTAGGANDGSLGNSPQEAAETVMSAIVGENTDIVGALVDMTSPEFLIEPNELEVIYSSLEKYWIKEYHYREAYSGDTGAPLIVSGFASGVQEAWVCVYEAVVADDWGNEETLDIEVLIVKIDNRYEFVALISNL